MLIVVIRFINCTSVFFCRKDEDKLYPAPPGNPLRIGDMIALKCSILTSAAYVSLCLNDFLSAKTYATNLLEETRASAGHKFVFKLKFHSIELDSF